VISFGMVAPPASAAPLRIGSVTMRAALAAEDVRARIADEAANRSPARDQQRRTWPRKSEVERAGVQPGSAFKSE